MHLYLIRHTKVNIAPGICYGQSDIELVESYLTDFQSIKEKLNKVSFDAIYTSPSKRCKKLADFLNYSTPIIDERLMELNFGEWEMQAWDNINHPDYSLWMNDFVNVSCPGGESFIDLHLRVESFLTDLEKTNYSNIAIITHSGVIRSVFAHIHKEELKDAFKREINFGDIFTIKIQ